MNNGLQVIILLDPRGCNYDVSNIGRITRDIRAPDLDTISKPIRKI